MARYNFFERMEREIDFQTEYEKIDYIILNERIRGIGCLEDVIEKFFRSWKYKENYVSFWELREEFDFCYEYSDNYREKIPIGTVTNLEEFLLYCEMILNMFYGVIAPRVSQFGGTAEVIKKIVKEIIEIIEYDLEKVNHEMCSKENGQVIIVQKNVAATAVADLVESDLAEIVIEYNHHLLQGDIKKKQILLKKLADALEPKRAMLKGINKTIESDFFYMVNSMNVRHNNCDVADKKKYNAKFATLTSQEQEDWYDEIYQEGLMAFLMLEQANREKRIAAFKNTTTP